MARRRSDKGHIRKISRIGNRSVGITLPVEFVRDLGWREKQKVVVRKYRGRLVVSDWKKKRRPATL